MTTPQNLDERFRDAVSALPPAGERRRRQDAVREGTTLTGARALELFDAQLTSRHLDLAARWLRGFNEGFAAIGSSGHEGNAAVAAALEPTDPALLYERPGAFYCARVGDSAASARDVLRGIVASAQDPSSAGRHQAFGSAERNIVPTTSAEASHLPRAVGLAYSLGNPRQVDPPSPSRWPHDAVVLASFGDTSANHATATAALTAAGWFERRGTPIPLLLVCEDATGTPDGWVTALLDSRPGLRYAAADGTDLVATFDAALAAVEYVRRERRPAVLHLSMVRLLTDAETALRSREEADRKLARDPLVGTARLVVESGLLNPDQALARYDAVGWEVRKIAEEVLSEAKLGSLAEVVAPLAPRRPLRSAHHIADLAARSLGPGAATRSEIFGGKLPERSGPYTLAQTINVTLTDAMALDPGMLIFGTGGAHGLTRNLAERFGEDRAFDTVRDETTILGLALGAGLAGRLPVPEIAHLADLHNAENQLRGAAAAMSYASAGAYRNPMVVRVAGLAYQQGSDDNSVAVLRDVPGLVVAVPARAADAAPMLRSCLASAAVDGSVCVFVEPVALYHTRDLHRPGDDEWLAPYAEPAQWATQHVPIGRARTYVVGDGTDLTVVTFGNGLRMSLRVAARLAGLGYGVRVVDLRWLSPLPTADLLREAAATGRVLVVDETRRSGGVAEGVLAALVDGGFVGAARRVAAADSPIPPGPAAQHVLVGEDAITDGARALLAR